MTGPANPLTDAGREAHIQDCARLFLKRYAEGDKVAARVWLALQNTAIRKRSAEQVQRMESAIEGCYFCDEAERARERRDA